MAYEDAPGASEEAKKLREALAKEMFAECEAELKAMRKAASDAAARIASLENQVRGLQGERSKLSERVKILEATEEALMSEPGVGLDRKLERALSDLSKAGRAAANASVEAARVREEAARVGQEKDALAEKVARFSGELDDAHKRNALLRRRMEKAQQESAAEIGTLRGELEESRAQIRAILAGIAAAQESPEATE